MWWFCIWYGCDYIADDTDVSMLHTMRMWGYCKRYGCEDTEYDTDVGIPWTLLGCEDAADDTDGTKDFLDYK